MSFWQWLKTAAGNATADPSIGWSEGMSPASVNDSARAMMARLAEERDDISGLLLTTGTSTAFLVTTNQGLYATPPAATPQDGQLIAVTVHATNGVSPTLAADGGTSYAIQSAAGTAVAAGTLIAGSPYTLRFSVANSAWMLRNFFGSPFTVPLGGIIMFTGDTVPNSNFVFPIGQAISRTTYAAYFSLVGTRFGVGDGTTTFNVPDLRERIVAGQGTMGGASSPGRITTAGSGIDGSNVGTSGGAQTVNFALGNLPSGNFPKTLGISDTRVFSTHLSVQGAAAGGSFLAVTSTPGGILLPLTLDSGSIGISGETQTGGSNTPLNKMPPTMILPMLLRIF